MFFRAWISENFRSKELRDTQGCKTVLSVFFYLFLGLRFRSFKAGIPRHDKLSRTIFFKKKKMLIFALPDLNRFIWMHYVEIISPVSFWKSSKSTKMLEGTEIWGSQTFWILFRFRWNKDFCNLIKNLRNYCSHNFL